MTITGWWFGTMDFCWECHHPNWQTHIFQRGWNHKPALEWSVSCQMLLLVYGFWGNTSSRIPVFDSDSGTLGRPVRFSRVRLCRKLHKRDLQYNVNPKKEKLINLSEAFCVNHTMSSSYFCVCFLVYIVHVTLFNRCLKKRATHPLLLNVDPMELELNQCCYSHAMFEPMKGWFRYSYRYFYGYIIYTYN